MSAISGANHHDAMTDQFELMTMRYMKHSPEAYFAEDAAKVAASLRVRAGNGEAAPTRQVAPSSIRLA
jgi:hypothetical protein